MGRTMTWEGRRLISTTKNGASIQYSYDDSGLRVSKQDSSGITRYTYDNGKIVHQYTENNNVISNELFFRYDENGAPLSVNYNGTEYFYVLNLQGDIIAIIDNSGAVVVEYTYDSWGKLIATTGTMATTLGTVNPLRYRGYYYDTDTGFYYCQSRYYDPEVGRWISVDSVIAGVGDSIQGYNMFAYCMNNPVNKSDANGNWPKWLTIAAGVVAAAATVALTVATLGAAAPAAACTITAIGMSIGMSYATAAATATVAVGLTTIAAAAYAGDIAYSMTTGESILLNTVFQGNEEAYNIGLQVTSIATGGMLELATMSPGVCFVAGTSVLAACGYIAIEEIKSGDLVWAENPETGEKELKEVVQTFVNETNELVHIFVNGEEIITTPEHPFYVPTKGWIGAIHLRAGDILVLQNGKYVTVEKIQHEILEAPITVYNFEVADFHTYYIGKNSILVHNTCKPTSPVKVSDNSLKKVDVHVFKKEFVHNNVAHWDVFKDTANNGSLWLGDKTQKQWIETGMFVEELYEIFPK